MEMGGNDTRPWSDVGADVGADVGSDDIGAGWERSNGLRRAWAITRWSALVFVCGLGVAFSLSIAVATIVTLLGSSL